MTACDTRIRPFPNDTEVVCEEEHVLDGSDLEHVGVVRDYAYAGSKTIIRWFELDRRTFHGEWPGPCPECGVQIPLGHGGRHA